MKDYAYKQFLRFQKCISSSCVNYLFSLFQYDQKAAKILKTSISSCHLGTWQENKLSGEEGWKASGRLGRHFYFMVNSWGSRYQGAEWMAGQLQRRKQDNGFKFEKQEDLPGENLGEGDMQRSVRSLKMALVILEIDLRWIQKTGLLEKWSSLSAKVYDSVICSHQ